MDYSHLAGRTAVVTGGGSGIGAAVCQALAAEGAAVMIGDIDPRAVSVAAQIRANGGRADYLRTDVSDEAQAAALMAKAATATGRLDILVANAGVAETKAPTHEMLLTDWERVININLTGVALCNKHALTHMLANGGSIVNMASILAHAGQANSTSYSAAKAGVVGFTRSAALTYARSNIRINAVSPGYVNTPLIERLPAEVRTRMIERQPTGRLAVAEEIAAVVLFLASDHSSIITGACINADGGYTAA